MEQKPQVTRERTPRDRALDLVSLLTGLRPTETHALWAVRITIVLGILFLIGHAYSSTLWDWLDLLIVPVTIAVVTTAGGAWFTRQRAQDTALEAYLDKMSELLIDKRLHREYGRYADTRVTARARTLAVLSQLDGKRKRTVLLFLREARLINRQQYVREGRVIYPRVVGLRGADLSNAYLQGIQLISTDRKEAVSLEGAVMEGADLRYADLERADLRGADLGSADLRNAQLQRTEMGPLSVEVQEPPGVGQPAIFRQNTILSKANLTGADLTGANLEEADLSGANLEGAIVTEEQLEHAKSLTGATMPDGTIHG